MMNSSKWRMTIIIGSFSCFTLLVTFTNKYVLSVQKFTYPTIFQSWQSGTLVVALLCLYALGYIQLSLVVNRVCFTRRLPAIVLFTGIIYTGSVALSKLAIPVFVVLHYLTLVLTFLIECILYKKNANLSEGVCLVLVVITAESMRSNDPQFNRKGYLWMIGHCSCIVLYKVIDTRSSKFNNISEIEKVFYNAFGSLVLLMTLSVIQGELYSALAFPSLYSRQFHIGCLCSAVFGSVLAVLRFYITTLEMRRSLCLIESTNKILLSITSLAIFEANYTVNMAISIMVALGSGLAFSYMSVKATSEEEKRPTHVVHNS